MFKKITLSIFLLSSCVSTAFSGGILTNTNQSARFARLICLDASTSIDAAYSNPAGLVMLKDGFHFAISNQSVYQTRNIRSEFAPLAGGNAEGNPWKKYKGEASAPIVPSIQAAYKKGPWVLSGNLAVAGGGGKATFNSGLPMFEAGISSLPFLITQAGQSLPSIPGVGLSAKGYSVDQFMEGSSFIYGAQLGASYQINNHFSLYGGFRLNIVNNSYEGHLRNLKVGINSSGLTGIGLPIPDNDGSLTNPSGFLDYAIANAAEGQKASLELLKKATSETGARLRNKQSGWGISPIIGINYNYEKLNIGIKYEFRTGLNVENKTKIDDTNMFPDGVNTPHDIPGLLTVGASYQLTRDLMLTAGYHHFFDSEAAMDRNKQNHISGGTDEYLFGAEYQIDDMFLISAGGQITRYGVKDEFQSDLSFSINSYSIGFGGAANVSKNVRINIGYFWTTYSDWEISYANYHNTGLAGTSIYSRTNKVFAAGVDFSF